MIKYSIQYSDVEGTEFTCEISNENYTGSEIILDGNCVLKSAFADEVYNPIWGKSLDISVVATIDEPLTDLWQDDEYYWTVILKKESQVKFIGYLSSEGVFEDYNTDKWELNITAIGPLGVINDLAYVQPTTGNPYTGFATIAQVVARTLTRGFNALSERLEIYVFAGFNGYDEPSNSTGGFFDYGNIDQSIFTLDEGETYQDCKVILSEILTSCALSIYQDNGKWYILPRHVEATATGVGFKVFDADGLILRSDNSNLFSVDIGNQGSSVLFHCNENQQLSMKRSVDTFTLEHLSEFSDQILDNPDIDNDGTTAPFWTIETGNNGIQAVDLGVGNGAFLKGRKSNNLGSETIFNSDGYILSYEQAFQVQISTTIVEPGLHFWPVEIVLDVNSLKYYYTGSEWTTDPGASFSKSRVYLESSNENDVSFTIDIAPLPGNGSFSIDFCEPLWLNPDPEGGTYTLTGNERVIIRSCDLIPVSGILEGRKEVFSKTNPKKERVKDNEVTRWDTLDDLSLKNVFFKPDLETRVEGVNNFGDADNFDRYRLSYYAAFARALTTQKKSLVFFGSVYGEVPFLGHKNYIGISDNMVITSYEYDTAKNITTLKCVAINNNLVLDGDIERLPIYVTGIKPTIVS